MVVWLIGLSGSGKTTLAERIALDVRRRGRKVVLLDGDRVREFFGNDLGHGITDRQVNAERICRMCSFLDEQGIDVICAILSLFPESRAWCRKSLSSYYEVFIDTPLDQLMERDAKGIYTKFSKGQIANVAGLDLKFPTPENPDLVISNTDSLEALLAYSILLADKICEIQTT